MEFRRPLLIVSGIFSIRIRRFLSKVTMQCDWPKPLAVGVSDMTFFVDFD